LSLLIFNPTYAEPICVNQVGSFSHP